MVNKRFAPFLILFLLISACSQNINNGCEEWQPTLEFDNIPVPIDINKTITLRKFPDYDYKIGEQIVLLVENHSNDQIWFPVDFNNFMLKKGEQPNTAEIIQDTLTGMEEVDQILEPKGSEGSILMVVVKPELVNQGESVDILLVIHGFRYENGVICNEMYQAMFDFTLDP